MSKRGRIAAGILIWVPAFVLVPLLVYLISTTPPPTPKADPPVTGIVQSGGATVPGARVRFAGVGMEVLADENGCFTLPFSQLGRVVTAYKDGFRIGAVPLSTTRSNISFRLTKLPEKDYPDYQWRSPTDVANADARELGTCASCHVDIYKEWEPGAHARSTIGHRFRDMFQGTDAMGRSAGWSMSADRPDGVAVCASCHSPTKDAILFDGPAEAEDAKSGPGLTGVSCDFCHKIVGPSGGQVGLTHGRFGLEYLRPEHGQVFFGPLIDAAGEDNAYSSFYRQGRLCASCHEGVIFGVKVYETYSEWQASAAGRRGTQCQNCHMKPSGRITNMALFHGGVERDARTISNHSFFDGSHVDMLRRCLKLSLILDRHAATVRATIDLRVDGAGHRVPTGLPDRNLTMVVEGQDAQGKPTALLDGSKIPAMAGPAFEGKPGVVYAKVLKDSMGHSPVPFWRAVPEFADNRLWPDQAVRQAFTFSPDTVSVHVRLVYRKFWPEVTRAKGWQDDSWDVGTASSRLPILPQP